MKAIALTFTLLMSMSSAFSQSDLELRDGSERLLEARMLFAEQVLKTYGEFHRFGIALTSEGDATLVAVVDIDALCTMTDQDFWKLIDDARSSPSGRFSEDTLVSALVRRSASDIVGFECVLRRYLQAADVPALVDAARIINGAVSDDSFLYFRCWLITLGKDPYQRAIARPDSLVPFLIPFEWHEEESLLYISTQAYSIVTNREEGDNGDFPRAVADSLGISYDSPNYRHEENDWKSDDELSQLFPALRHAVDSWSE